MSQKSDEALARRLQFEEQTKPSTNLGNQHTSCQELRDMELAHEVAVMDLKPREDSRENENAHHNVDKIVEQQQTGDSSIDDFHFDPEPEDVNCQTDASSTDDPIEYARRLQQRAFSTLVQQQASFHTSASTEGDRELALQVAMGNESMAFSTLAQPQASFHNSSSTDGDRDLALRVAMGNESMAFSTLAQQQASFHSASTEGDRDLALRVAMGNESMAFSTLAQPQASFHNSSSTDGDRDLALRVARGNESMAFSTLAQQQASFHSASTDGDRELALRVAMGNGSTAFSTLVQQQASFHSASTEGDRELALRVAMGNETMSTETALAQQQASFNNSASTDGDRELAMRVAMGTETTGAEMAFSTHAQQQASFNNSASTEGDRELAMRVAMGTQAKPDSLLNSERYGSNHGSSHSDTIGQRRDISAAMNSRHRRIKSSGVIQLAVSDFKDEEGPLHAAANQGRPCSPFSASSANRPVPLDCQSSYSHPDSADEALPSDVVLDSSFKETKPKRRRNLLGFVGKIGPTKTSTQRKPLPECAPDPPTPRPETRHQRPIPKNLSVPRSIPPPPSRRLPRPTCWQSGEQKKVVCSAAGCCDPTGAVPSLPVSVSGTSVCTICRRSGAHFVVMDNVYHAECFVCASCGGTIDHTLPFAVSTNDHGEKQAHHKKCFAETFGIACSVCRQKIPANEDGHVSFIKHPFFKQEQMCLQHADDPGRRCTSCHRFEPADEPFADLHDAGRCLCYACCRTVVVNNSDVKPLWDNVLRFFEHKLRLPVWAEMRNIPILLMGFDELKDHVKRLGSVHSASSQPFSRGICLTDEREGVVSIACLSSLPRDLTSGILAHEATHAWIRLHPEYSGALRSQVEEGCAQLISILFLTDGLDSPSDSAETDDTDGPSNEELRQYFRFCIETEVGTSYKQADRSYREIGIEELMHHVVHTQSFPFLQDTN